MIKYILIFLGSLSLGIGIIGIVVPGLPTTTFVLIAAACYVRSSKRLYTWLLNHKVFGRFIRVYREHKAMTLRSKIIALVSMWSMITLSIFVFVDSLVVKLILLGCGMAGTIVLLIVKTYREEKLQV